jgi:hypothetical protein
LTEEDIRACLEFAADREHRLIASVGAAWSYFRSNLSRKLVSRLADIFPDSSHVQFHGFAEKTNTEISLFYV